jgi:hypothetical protein
MRIIYCAPIRSEEAMNLLREHAIRLAAVMFLLAVIFTVVYGFAAGAVWIVITGLLLAIRLRDWYTWPRKMR